MAAADWQALTLAFKPFYFQSFHVISIHTHDSYYFFLRGFTTGHVLRVTSYPDFCNKHLHFPWGAMLFRVTCTSQFYMFQLHWSTYRDGEKETISKFRRLFSSNCEDITSTVHKTSMLVNASCLSLEKVGMKMESMNSVSLLGLLVFPV